ncbi:MAG TPA: acyl-CoA reductase [Chryseosolibacter sp.]|nr:acyl-CoA reductase [Chryseosolibacter sp.]
MAEKFMTVQERIAAFEKLGNYIGAIDAITFKELSLTARNENSWFTEDSVRQAFSGIVKYLNGSALAQWTAGYSFENKSPKRVAVITAGNIPLVGFHDLLAVLVSGNKLIIRPSSKDTALMKYVISKLVEIEPRFESFIEFTEQQLRDFDAVIATGSDNSSRYFDYYFKKYPHIIRKNRSSCAILSGFESEEELTTLAADVFTYFGLGCRNVSKLFVPVEYDFAKLFESWQSYEKVLLHHKYHNNYDYQKSILLINRDEFLDNGFILLQENKKLVSPISVLYYESYNDWNDLIQKLNSQQDKIQCVVGNVSQASVRIGEAQSPGLDDYADQINTLKFLSSLG